MEYEERRDETRDIRSHLSGAWDLESEANVSDMIYCSCLQRGDKWGIQRRLVNLPGIEAATLFQQTLEPPTGPGEK